MIPDIDGILGDWPFDPESHMRKVVGADGRERLQVRVCQGAWNGILQMELEGRPDHVRPHGFDFALDFHKDALRRHREARQTGDDFSLDSTACAEIFDESFKLYNRYVILLGLQDYERVLGDTERNMEAFRFVNRYAADQDDRMRLERWWPYILRIHGTARAMIALRDGDAEGAREVVRETLRDIEDLPEVDAEEFGIELERARQTLGELEQTIGQTQGKSQADRLRDEMAKAVSAEHFREAARLRDQIQGLQSQKPE
jgi:hypothetical protein